MKKKRTKKIIEKKERREENGTTVKLYENKSAAGTRTIKIRSI